MHLFDLNAITDIDELRQVTAQMIARHAAKIGKRDAEIRFKSAKLEKLTHLLAVLRRAQFAARSEKFDPTQQTLFDEAVAEKIAAIKCEIEALTPAVKRARARARAQPKREPLPVELTRGETRIEPLKFVVLKTISPKYTCRACETIVTAPTSPAIIERSIASPGLLAHFLTSNLVDHLPLCRQCEMLKRSGVELSRSTLSIWVGACGFALQPLVDALRVELHRCSVILADETPVRMHDPKAGRGKSKATYLFSYRRGEIDEPPIIDFDSATSRCGSHARAFLADYGGALVVDDYAGYKHRFQQTPMRELPYWAHARRKFFDLHAANKSEIAQAVLTRIAELYVVENEARSFDAIARKDHHERHARPRIEQRYVWHTRLRPSSAAPSGIDHRRCGCAAACLASLARTGPFLGGIR